MSHERSGREKCIEVAIPDSQGGVLVVSSLFHHQIPPGLTATSLECAQHHAQVRVILRTISLPPTRPIVPTAA